MDKGHKKDKITFKILFLSFLAQFFFVFIIIANAQTAQMTQSCSKVAEFILSPYKNDLERAKAALNDYEEQLSKHIEALKEKIKALEEAKELFDIKEAREKKQIQDKITSIETYIKILKKKKEYQIAKLNRRADLEKFLKNQYRYSYIQNRLRELTNKIDTAIEEKQRQIKSLQDQLTKISEKYQSGNELIFIPALSYRYSLKKIKKLIEETKKDIEIANTGRITFTNRLCYIYSRRGLANLIKAKENNLKRIEEKIKNGNYKFEYIQLYPGRNCLRCSKNELEKLISKQEDKINNLKQQLDNGNFKAFNSVLGREISNGYIENRIQFIKNKINKFTKDYNEQRARVIIDDNYNITGKQLIDRLKRASTSKERNDIQDKLRKWRTACQNYLKQLERELNRFELAKKEHHKAFIKKIEKEKLILSKLKKAVTKFPCL